MLLYHLCRTFGCLPSQLDGEDIGMMERLALVDYIVQRTRGEKAKEVARARN